MITSANNTQVKNIIQLNQKAKARREQGLFVAEGRKMFGEAPKDWISRVYVTESLTADESLMKQVMELPEEKREMVHNMKSLNIPLDTISQVTGLSIEEIKSL